MSKIISINAGSSSLKFQLFEMPNENVITKGKVERIGAADSDYDIIVNGEEIMGKEKIADHTAAVKLLLNKLIELKVIDSLDEITGIGHRVVHGGRTYSDSVVITQEVENKIEELYDFAPLHNPANLAGVQAFREVLPNVPAVAVFDTAFHQTMPKSSYIYSIPYEYYEEYGVRKYGFHGASHKYVSERAAELLDKPVSELRLISCHIGNGASIAAIKNGKSIDTSMGFTPLAGLTMGTRSGDIDSAIIPYIMEKTGASVEQVIDQLNKKSGMLGLSGFSNDFRDIETEAKKGNERAQLALSVFVERIQKYIGSYLAVLGGADAIIFTAGVGENSASFREYICNGFEFVGLQLDPSLNTYKAKNMDISTPDSKIKALVIPTNEELMIARETVRVTEAQPVR